MSLSILIFFVIVFALVCTLRLARIGALSAFLLAGILAGPYVFDIFHLNESWNYLGELGVLFLWFNIGLEINMRRLWDMRKSIFGFGAAQVLMVAVMLFPLLAGITSWSVMACVMVALLLSMSSTSTDLPLLTERNQLNTNMGRQTFAILLFQDLLSIPLLAMVPVFSGKTFSLGDSAVDVFVISVVLITGVVILGRFVLNPLMKLVAKLKSKEAFLLAVMLNIALWAVLLSALGLPAGLGAFVAGMLMSETIYRHQISADISPYAMLFLAFFFISLGLGLNLSFLAENWYIIAGGLAGLILVKFFAIFMVARVRNVSNPDAVMIALLLAQGGEFGLLMLQTIKNSGIDVLHSGPQEILTAVIILSIMATPLLIAVFDRLRRTGKIFDNVPEPKEVVKSGKPDVIICGFGRVGQIIAKMLSAKNISYIALDLDVNAVMQGREQGFNVVYGDCKNLDVLRDCGLSARKTRAVVLALDNATTASLTVSTIHGVSSKIHIFARARNVLDSKFLLSRGVMSAQPETIESSFYLGQGVLEHLGVSHTKIDDLLSQLRQNNYSEISQHFSEEE